MDRSIIRNAGLSLVLCAGLGMGVAAMANQAYAAETADKAAATETVAAAYTDGSYTAEGKGIGGKVPVTVEVKGGVIATVTVGDNSETQGIGSKAIEQLPAAIVEANGLEGVDAVSGATVTSKAIFSAVEEALEQAKGGAAEQAAPAEAEKAEEPAAEQAAPAEDAKADEKAEPAAEEKADTKDEKAADTKDAKADDKAAKDDKAADEKTEDAKADEKADDKKAADEKDAKDDKAAEGYADGDYTAEGKGIGGKVPVTVTVKDGKVSDVKVGDNSETQGIGSKAIEQLPA